MFDLSLVELLFIAVVALIVIGPKDLPKVLASIFKLFRQVQNAYADMRSQVEELVKESGIEDTKDEIKTIIDQHGEVQEVYDISDFIDKDGNVKMSGATRHPERGHQADEGSKQISPASKDAVRNDEV